MRLGLVARHVLDAHSFEQFREHVVRADRTGLELVLLCAPQDRGEPDPLVLASALASVTNNIRLVVEVTAGENPVHLAERISVADRVSNGRIVIVLRDGGIAGSLAETATILGSALVSRPFKFQGRVWSVPSDLPGNDVIAGRAIAVTPSPTQLNVPIWFSGAAAMDIAADQAVSWLPELNAETEFVAAWWARFEARWPPLAARANRPVQLAGSVGMSTNTLVRTLLEYRSVCGADIALLELPSEGGDNWMRWLAGEIWPRVQLERLPDGLEDYWLESVQWRP